MSGRFQVKEGLGCNIKRFLVVEHKNRSRLAERIINQEKKEVQILKEFKLTKREAIRVLH